MFLELMLNNLNLQWHLSLDQQGVLNDGLQLLDLILNVFNLLQLLLNS
jgi:hypothetical protein